MPMSRSNSMPDLNSVAKKECRECRLCSPYVECAEDVLALPPPLPPAPRLYKKAQADKKAENQALGGTALVSLILPHKILSISHELCAHLGFAVEETQGRSITFLQGPKTDTVAFTAAIKNTGVMDSMNLSLIVYSKSGQEKSVLARFSPFMSSADTLAGCLIQIAPLDAANDSAKISFDKMPAPAVNRSNTEAADIRRQYRARYNFATGLSIQRALAAKCSSTGVQTTVY